MLVDGLADGGEEGGAAAQKLFYQTPQGCRAFGVQAADGVGASLFGCGAAGCFEPQRSELAEQVFLVNQICVHHGVCSLGRAFFRFWSGRLPRASPVRRAWQD
ncbi:hypothetical protein ALQ28_04196 [Pseudomonas syringae pv. delphinii]|uniref:Uncharacterized protein n=1 Tax=Pseudomonas syringae pv. delphinii TaxID=192088 RepID=A0A3M4AQH4_9PSED|nr:hypothetical protein ALQ28_04196 [Pseudomonas syringae pv. delphinii]